MFFRNIWSAAEITSNCRALLLQQSRNPVGYGRIQTRNAFNSSRRGGRPITEPDPLESIQIESGPLQIKGLLRPFVFTIGVSAASVLGCVIWEYETLRAHSTTLLRRPGSWLNAQQKKILAQFKPEPGPVQKWWRSLKESEKVFYPILAANVLVFGAWRVRALQPYMVKYFCSNPSGSKNNCAICLPMILSTFSHYSPLHLMANMYVLYSFMPAAVASLGSEQFVAMYLSAGVISSFASFLYKVVANQPGLSLGASGAIMSVLSYVCVQYPDTRLSIIFLPMYTFAAGTAIKAIMCMDLTGVLLGWKFFDHAAHLGGALFGIAWCHWGSTHIWGKRDKFLQYYHAMRRNDTGR
ncbi:presenilin-associated rhomboid-like protein, mitochondrial isoform X2 [Plodia interpunctella]|uniref:presenilin-associated rhomboid-like protein, mitochondrial isoform X2 n=1 Tax=Plodia interpunctella TaxID=58824 RepID=UPI0023674919|nr:presenilins-associated rhomboid-like protein, mitochondrial isoform X2 [Plodia interpunctella]